MTQQGIPDEEEIASYEMEVSQRSLIDRAVDQAEAIIAVQHVLQRSTVGMTYAQDWVIMGEKAFLQNVGCERTKPLWAISFDKLDLRNDVIREEIGEGHVQFVVCMTGHSARTGESTTDIGNRSSNCLWFIKRWEAAKDNSTERKLVENDIRKAAMANCRGRIIRSLTGTNGMPPEKLAEFGMDPDKIHKADYQKGTKGGSGNLASEPQLNKIAGLAVKEGKLEGDDDWDTVKQWCREAKLTSRDASDVIKRLIKASNTVPLPAFWQAIGLKLTGDDQAPKDAPTGEEGAGE